MKATALLKKQHHDTKLIFKQLARGGVQVSALLDRLVNDLAAHMTIEHEIFYPAVHELDDDLVLESFEEHALIELALKRLLGTKHSDPSFQARVTATRELVEHHVAEEEQDMFPGVEKAFDARRLNELGARMQARFDAVQAAGFAASVPKGGSPKTSSDLAKRKAMAA